MRTKTITTTKCDDVATKRLFLILLFSHFLILNVALAQKTPFEKYGLCPPEMEQVFLDHVAGYSSKVITMGEDQYVGQVDRDGKLYGYGRYVKGDGTQIIGKFRDGQLIFGITLGKESAIVGNNSFYSSYSLTSGKLEYVFLSNTRQLLDTKALDEYAFVSMRYSNGDQYIGEVFRGLRHGYGIYYYANGDIWFGQYANNLRCGFGALFTRNNTLHIGQWEAEDARRDIYVKEKK